MPTASSSSATRRTTTAARAIRTSSIIINGVRVGDIGNNGTSDIDYVSSIAKTKAGSNTPFMNGTTYGQSFADFDQSYDPINGFSVAGTGSSYTVNDGDTLQTVALAAWGDASLWYLIAQANGMTGAETLMLLPDVQPRHRRPRRRGRAAANLRGRAPALYRLHQCTAWPAGPRPPLTPRAGDMQGFPMSCR